MTMRRRLGVALMAVVSAVPVAVAIAPTPAGAAVTSTRFCSDPAPSEPVPDQRLESYEAIRPQRLVDTRDGTGSTRAPLGAGCTLRLELGASSVPSNATAVALSVTAVSDVRGYVAVHPCASGRPPTSNLNARPGVATPNLVVGLLDSTHTVCIFANRSMNLVVDLAGWWGPGSDRFDSVEPVRIYDTRELPGGNRLPAGVVRDVPVGTSIPADATTAVVNLTVTGAASRGWLLAYPCGAPTPLASNLNFLAGESRAVAAIVGLGESGPAAGRICVRSNADVHFIIDVVGFYAPEPGFGPAPTTAPVAGTRVADTRVGTGGWSGQFTAGEVRSLDPLRGRADAEEASAVVLNVVATNAAGRGHLRIYPCGDVPLASSLNFPAVTSAANLVPVELSAQGRICVFASQRTDVVIDLFGVVGVPDGFLVERLEFGSLPGFPQYDPAGRDYGVICGSGATTTFDVTVVPLPGTTVRLDGVVVAAGAHRRTMATGDVMQVTFQRGGRTDVHHVRCLPSDFPELTVERPGSPTAGWYLTAFGRGGNPSPGPYVAVLDDRGAPVWYKRADQIVLDVKVVPGTDDLSVSTQGQFFGTVGDDVSRRVYDLSGQLLDDIRAPQGPPDLPIDHHDFVHLPGGGGAYISYPLREDVDLTGLGSGFAVDDNVVDGAIVELDADGDVVWTWSSADHFADDESTFPQRFGRYPTDPPEVDIVHINSIDRLADGDYVVSARHLDTVFRVDRATGEVLWTLGPATSPGAVQLSIVGDPLGGPLRQHDARLVGDVLTMHDNRTAAVQGAARFVAYRINAGNGTATMIRQYTDSLARTSNALGSARLAADGSVLVNWGALAPGSPLGPNYEEVDAGGRRLLAITQSAQGTSYRIVKYPAAQFDRSTLRAEGGGSLEAP